MPYNLQNFRDNFPCLANQDGITNADVLFGYKVLIMQCCTADRSARERHTVKNCCRCQRAGSSDLNFNIAQYRFLFFWRILESDRPFGKFNSCAECFPQREIIDFDHRTVDIKIILMPSLVDSMDILNDIGKISIDRKFRDHLEAK